MNRVLYKNGNWINSFSAPEIFSENDTERRYLVTVFWSLMYRYVRSRAGAFLGECFVAGEA